MAVVGLQSLSPLSKQGTTPYGSHKVLTMEKMVFTALNWDEFRALIIDSVNACLRHHAAQQPPRQEDPPGQAGEAYITKKQAARLLSCSPGTIDNRARDGHLARHYVGKAVRFDRQEVLNLAKRHTSTKQRIKQ